MVQFPESEYMEKLTNPDRRFSSLPLLASMLISLAWHSFRVLASIWSLVGFPTLLVSGLNSGRTPYPVFVVS